MWKVWTSKSTFKLEPIVTGVETQSPTCPQRCLILRIFANPIQPTWWRFCEYVICYVRIEDPSSLPWLTQQTVSDRTQHQHPSPSAPHTAASRDNKPWTWASPSAATAWIIPPLWSAKSRFLRIVLSCAWTLILGKYGSDALWTLSFTPALVPSPHIHPPPGIRQTIPRQTPKQTCRTCLTL